MSLTLEYSSNNSGGSWWLCDDDWKAMESAGWIVEWKPGGGRWLGALATTASIPAADMDDAKRIVREWEALTNQSAADEGCNCCGKPHYFTLVDEDGRHVGDPVDVWSERGWS